MELPGTGAARLVDRPGPGSNKLEGGFQKDASCQHHYCMVEQSSPKWVPPVTVFPDWALFASSCLSGWVSQDQVSAGCSDLGIFQTTASVCALRDSISYSSLGLLKVRPTGFQSQVSWVLVLPAQESLAVEPDVVLQFFFPWFYSCYYPAPSGSPT